MSTPTVVQTEAEKITNFERGLLVGIPLGAIAGPSITLALFIFIFCYDFGFYRIASLGQRVANKYLNILHKAAPDQVQVPLIDQAVSYFAKISADTIDALDASKPPDPPT